VIRVELFVDVIAVQVSDLLDDSGQQRPQLLLLLGVEHAEHLSCAAAGLTDHGGRHGLPSSVRKTCRIRPCWGIFSYARRIRASPTR
jgi:hypothetical protein